MSKVINPNVSRALRPFEVVAVKSSSSASQVAVHLGVILDFGTHKQITTEDFAEGPAPQDLTEELDSSKFLDVDTNDFVYIMIPTAGTDAKPSLEAGDQITLDDISREDYRVCVLAKIEDSGKAQDPSSDIPAERSGSGVMDIKYLYKSDLNHQSTFFPPFTPIMWKTGGESAEYRAIFTPGAVHLSHTADASEPEVFLISGIDASGNDIVSPMEDFPIMKVTPGQSWYLEMHMTPSFGFADSPLFSATEPQMRPGEAPYSIDVDPAPDESKLGECAEQSGFYALRALEFLSDEVRGLSPNIFWRSDYIIHKNPRCHTTTTSGSGETGAQGYLAFVDCWTGLQYKLEWSGGKVLNQGWDQLQLGNCFSGSDLTGDSGEITIDTAGVPSTLIETDANGIVINIPNRTLYARQYDVCVTGVTYTKTFLCLD